MRRPKALAGYIWTVTLLFAASAVCGFAQTTAASSETGGVKAAADQVSLLRQQLLAQQKEIEQLEVTLKAIKEKMDQGASATQSASPQVPSLGQVASRTPVVPEAPRTSATSKALSVPAALPPAPVSGQRGPREGAVQSAKSPLEFHVGQAAVKLGGFLDATSFFRTTNVGSGIGTSFGAIPFSNSSAGQLTETRLSAQNSRVSLMFTAPVSDTTNVKAYLETDFLGLQPANAYVTSNSDSLRLRLYWADVTHGKFEFLGGQSWSMLVPNRTGLSPQPSDIFYSQDMDTNYQVGLTWSRQLQFRFIYRFSDQLAAGISIENPDQYVGGAVLLPGGSCTPAVTIPATKPSPYCSQVDTGGATSTPNTFPDVIAKVAYDPIVGGKHMHVEAAGLLRSFKTFTSGAGSQTATGGGGSLNFNLEVVKDLHLILNTFYSDGGGRYIFGLGPDFIVTPAGAPSLVHAGSVIAGVEWQASKQNLLYGYYGGAYYGRNTGIDIDPATLSPSFIGFGFPGSSSSSNKSVQEATLGLIQTYWKNPRYGALQLITQYSYLTRNPWSVASGSPKDAHLSMVYGDIRYTLP